MVVGRAELPLELLLRGRVVVIQLVAIKLHILQELLILWRPRRDRMEPRPCWEPGSSDPHSPASHRLLRFGAQSRDGHVTGQQLTPTFFFSFLTSSSASSARETNWNTKPGECESHIPPHYSKHLEDGVRAGGGAWLMRTVGVMLRPPWCFSSLCSAPSLKNPPRRSSSPAAPGCAERLPGETPLCSTPLRVSWSVLRRQRSRFRVRTRARLSSKGVNDPQRSLFTPAEGSLKLIVPALGREIPVLTGMCLMLEQIRECRI